MTMPAKHQPTFYLTEEAAQKRITRLVERIAKEGRASADYRRVPPSIRKMVDALIDGRLFFADQMEAA
jgi:hypothetical protein